VSAQVILSPHPDDAVLSLWHVLAADAPVRVINVFGGSPAEHEGDAWWDRLTGAPDSVARAAERHAEDRAALGLAGREPENLGLLDGQYREGRPELAPIVEAIAQATAEDALLLAPAALDGHRDHRLVRSAALGLRRQRRRVALYADVPHATLYGWPAWVTGGEPDPYLDPEAFWTLHVRGTGIALGPEGADVHALEPVALDLKREAVRAYRTQVPALEHQYSLFGRPDVLAYEVVWPLS
jgi:LmbE family N-acetylglucosaminyl deacetylase